MSQAQWEFLASMLSLVTAVVAGIFLAAGILPARFVNSIETIIHRWASQRLLCFILIPALSLAANTAIAIHNGIPHPKIHDEFSYLLAADTFAHGRLTNPSPPFPEHFETPQELVQPTRMSKYPPGQGLALMIGQIVSGEPIFGVWLSTALACMAIYWMLLAFVPLPWALVGGVLAALNPELLDWSQNYWGGSMAVLGGAILLGAWGRLMVRASVGSSIWLGIGLAVLANTRPFEGLMFSLPLLLALVIHGNARQLRFIIPSGGVILLTAIWMGFYNLRVTGQIFRLPYFQYISQYAVYPLFWFQKTRPIPTYSNPSQQWVHLVLDRYSYDQLRQLHGLAKISLIRTYSFVADHLKLAILFPGLLIGIVCGPDRRTRWIIAALVFLLIGILAQIVDLPHYSAPAMAGLLLLVIRGWARIRCWTWKGRASGRVLAHALAVGWFTGACMAAAHGVSRDSLIADQQAVVDRLGPGRYLVFVRYEPGYPLGNEFVYNPADLDSSRILWVHYFGPAADEPVAERFPGRQIWLLDAGNSLKLTEYAGLKDGINNRSMKVLK